MRYGAQAVARALAKRVTVLLLALGCFALVGDPRGGGVEAGLLLAGAVFCHATAFGVDATLKAAPAGALRLAAAVGVLIAAGAGLWGARAFEFTTTRIGGVLASPGGALMQLAAALVVAGVSAFIFLCLAGRVTALGEDR